MKTLTIFVLSTACVSASAQSAVWIKSYQGKPAAAATADKRFAPMVNSILPQHPHSYGASLAENASAYMTNGAAGDISTHGDVITVQGCANHGSGCAMLWSRISGAPFTALCVADKNLWLYTSSAASVPQQLLGSVRTWMHSLHEDGIALHPTVAYVVTRTNRVHKLDLRVGVRE